MYVVMLFFSSGVISRSANTSSYRSSPSGRRDWGGQEEGGREGGREGGVCECLDNSPKSAEQMKGKEEREEGKDGDTYLGESIEGVSMLAVEGPAYLLVQILQPEAVLVRHVPEDGVDGLGFVVTFFALDHVIGGDPALGEIDVAWRGKREEGREGGRKDEHRWSDCAHSSFACSIETDRETHPCTHRYIPLSLSTRSTDTTSSLFTRISFLMERMRRRDSSECRIMPCYEVQG